MLVSKECLNDIIADDFALDILLKDKELVQVICTASRKLKEKFGEHSNIYLEVYFDENFRPDIYIICETSMSQEEYKKLQEELDSGWFKQIRGKLKNYNLSVGIETY